MRKIITARPCESDTVMYDHAKYHVTKLKESRQSPHTLRSYFESPVVQAAIRVWAAKGYTAASKKFPRTIVKRNAKTIASADPPVALNDVPDGYQIRKIASLTWQLEQADSQLLELEEQIKLDSEHARILAEALTTSTGKLKALRIERGTLLAKLANARSVMH